MEEELISIGKIMGTYGYQGFVRIMPLTDFPERFKHLRKVFLCHNNTVKEVIIEEVSLHKQAYLLKIEGIDSRETAQEYRNALLQIEESQLYPLPDGYYYHFQLQGLQVYDEDKGFLGELVEIIETGANDVYVVKSQKYGEILLPAIKNVIMEVNLQEKKMLVKLLPGLVNEDLKSKQGS
ncbi:MAG: ribosome maturation factor RimM [Syntrophomonadaceae bacterium]|jgi:16S rRNA processing protein RimM